ncbi:uncharacterized protein ASPGLDRAFT_66021 [Aspergillus glaucus CBS 516.65]|uniref:FAD-dependent oxidoreductase 2 FAD-binding domain-containing protein n=1 Tax=Aspergillus glaucus CBS 516.65 TaxID=1160497 RepID=A0A1L9VMW6_ASPGL|nr:hypothetical protein ASPGLDRAFT_66021 [Aspergillus glaucus CBS 516.65]OJJ85266.1 hypothetical protein ASPGLDRAFT_66021 [Aspergillus glaucus CBS 516.65]
MVPTETDILIIGSGNAGLCAAISAAQTLQQNQPNNKNSRILLIDKCPKHWAGGNSYFTAGAFRTAHNGLSDLLPLVNNVDASAATKIDIPPYTNEAFMDDMQRVTGGRTDATLSKTLVEDSNETVKWLTSTGVRFQLSFNRQAYEVDGRLKFWGGLALKTEDGGKGLVKDLWDAARELGVEVVFETAAKRLVTDAEMGRVRGVVVSYCDRDTHANCRWIEKEIRAGAVILAAGGFEANPRLRAQYLGPNWDMAFVRGTPYNTGECLEMALQDQYVSAQPRGNWSGCHCVAWDAHATPDTGNREVSNEYTKSGYPLGIMVNQQGNRFIDEGSDMRNYTYAVVGRAILNQPGHVAFQIWDKRTSSWLREEEYRAEVVQRIEAPSIDELAEECARGHGLGDPRRFVESVAEYNRAVYARQDDDRNNGTERKWDPSVKDSLLTQSTNSGLSIPKSNWALPIDQPPFLAVKVSAGITFTFGGLSINPETAGVISTTGTEVPGLYCAGEMVGGLFYDNYPGGSGLTSGAVFGRRAGRAAAGAVPYIGP